MEEEKSLLKNPDLLAQEAKYVFDMRLQQEILGMLLRDRSFLSQSMGLVKPEYFLDNAHSLICFSLISYFSEHRQMPPEYVIREMIRESSRDDVTKMRAFSELKICLSSHVPGLSSREFNLTKITEFAKEQALRSALAQAANLIQRKNDNARWLKIEDVFRKALAVDRSFDEGLDYFSTIDERYERMRQEKQSQEIFLTGFPDLDKLLTMGGLKRGEIASFMGLPGTGKSNFLIKAARTNIANGKNVVYISLEMSQDKIAARMDSQIARVTMDRIPDKDLGEIGESTEIILKQRVEYLFSGEIKRPKFKVKQFPAGQADVNTIRAFLSQLNLDGFKPDLLIVDYVGEMKDFEGIKTHESRQRIVRDLRALAVEEQICVMTAMQPNRSARDQQAESEIDDSALGDSFGQARPLDALWSINQNRQEKDAGVGRIFVVKHRDGESRKVVYFKQLFDCLDFENISAETHSMLSNKALDNKSEQTKIKEVFTRPKPESFMREE